MSTSAITNPFPGPQPYRAADRGRFFGRGDLSHKLQGTILSNRCVTVYGPSGAGKSSLLQASVFPELVERHDVRLIRVDAWPEGEEPIRWLASVMNSELGFGDLIAEVPAKAAIFKATRGAARASSRLVVVYLDQLEQLLFLGRTVEETAPFFDCLEELVDLPLRNIRVVLSLREDYLGRFRDRLRDLRRVTENGFRVGPLNVQELTETVVLSAAAGIPPQSWSSDEMHDLMMQVRMPGQAPTDDAEAQSAYAQIICRALFQERALGKTVDASEAEPILQGYLGSTMSDLGDLHQKAQQLLEDHLVGADGSRTLRTEKELARVVPMPDLAVILKQLEGAAILRAEEHHGSRYFEIGHDWLARKVFEQRQERERFAEQQRIEAEQARQLAQMRAQQRRSQRVAIVAAAIAALVGASAIVAWFARARAIVAQNAAEKAEHVAQEAEKRAQWERDEASDLRVMAGYLALQSQGDSTGAMKLLSEVKKPEERSGWVAYANAALEKNALFVTLSGHREALRTATYSADGLRVLTASDDKTARIWNADGTGDPIVLAEHRGAITSASFSPDREASKSRVLTTSADGTARIWSIQGTEAKSIVLAGAPNNAAGQTAEVSVGAWSADGQRVVVASIVTQELNPPRPGANPTETIFVRVHAASDGSIVGEYAEHKGRVNGAVFLDDTHIVTVSDDKTARVWDGTTTGKSTQLPGHVAPVLFVAVNRDKGLVVTTSADTKARVFKVGANAILTPFATLEGHSREVLHAAISTDGTFVATASADHTARVWNIAQPQKKGTEVVLAKHNAAVTFVAFRPTDPLLIATASRDNLGRVFRQNAPDKPFVLTGHTSPVASIEWNPAGDRLVTAAFDVRQSAAADHSARIWTAPLLGQLSTRRPSETNRVFHVAAFGAEQQVFASAYADATVELRQSNDAEPTLFKALADERWGFVSAAVPSPDGQRIAIASFGAGVASGKHDTTAKWVRAVQIFQASAPDKPLQTREVPAVAKFVAWNEKGDRIVAALEDATAMVFAASNNAPPVVFKGHTKWLTSAAFSIDGTKLVTTSLDKTALVFDSRGNGPPIARFEHPGAVYSATFDPTGQRVATACIDGKVRIFDIGGGAPTELDAKGIPLYRIAWSADGSRLAAATSTSTILAWSHLSWPLAAELRPSVLQTETPAVALAFSKGSDKLMAAATDRIYSWNLDVVGLQFALREENRDCLPVNDRALYLNEPVDVAIKAFQDCQTAQHRGSPAESPKTVVREDLVVARLFVVPVDAEVEWDGTRATPRDGLFELWGKAGEKKKIRVVKGAWSTETEVLIENSGATPPVIDLEAISGSNGDVKKAAKQLGEGDFDSLVPVEFQ